MHRCGRELSRSGRTEGYVHIGGHGGLDARLDALRSDRPARPVQPTFAIRDAWLTRRPTSQGRDNRRSVPSRRCRIRPRRARRTPVRHALGAGRVAALGVNMRGWIFGGRCRTSVRAFGAAGMTSLPNQDPSWTRATCENCRSVPADRIRTVAEETRRSDDRSRSRRFAPSARLSSIMVPRPARRAGRRHRKRGGCGTPLQDVDGTPGGYGERTAWSGARCWLAS